MAERGVVIDKDEYGRPVDDRYKRLGANGATAGMYVRFEPGFGLNVHIGHHALDGIDTERMSMSITGWESLCALVDEWRAREAATDRDATSEPGPHFGSFVEQP